MVLEAKAMTTQTDLPQPLSYDDYRALPEDGKRYELWDGIPVEMSPGPRLAHATCVGNLMKYLREWVDRHPGARVFAAPLDLILRRQGRGLALQPDLLLLVPGSQARLVEDGIEGGPDLVVEVLSPSTARKDRVHKLRRYAEAGVRSYWLVDPEAQTVERLALRADGGPIVMQPYGDEDCVTDEVLPGLSLPLPLVFEGLLP